MDDGARRGRGPRGSGALEPPTAGDSGAFRGVGRSRSLSPRSDSSSVLSRQSAGSVGSSSSSVVVLGDIGSDDSSVVSSALSSVGRLQGHAATRGEEERTERAAGRDAAIAAVAAGAKPNHHSPRGRRHRARHVHAAQAPERKQDTRRPRQEAPGAAGDSSGEQGRADVPEPSVAREPAQLLPALLPAPPAESKQAEQRMSVAVRLGLHGLPIDLKAMGGPSAAALTLRLSEALLQRVRPEALFSMRIRSAKGDDKHGPWTDPAALPVHAAEWGWVARGAGAP